MSGVSKIELPEAAQDLLQLMEEQKQLRQRSRMQVLYLLTRSKASSFTYQGLIPN